MTDSKFENLAPFAVRSGMAIIGRQRLMQVRKHLCFVLFTEDLTENSMRKMASQFDCPIVQHYKMDDIEQIFGFRGTKIVGFRKSTIATSLYREIKEYKIKKQPTKTNNDKNIDE